MPSPVNNGQFPPCMSRKKICLISLSVIARDSRVLRHLKFLGLSYDLIVVGYGEDPSPQLPGVNVKWHALRPAWGGKLRKVVRTLLRWPGRIIPLLDWAPDMMMADWRAACQVARQQEFDSFLVMMSPALLMGISQQNKTGRPFVMDYHEYAPLEAEEKTWHRWFHGPQMYRILKRYGHRAAASATVNEPFVSRFEQEFGFRPITVMNAPELKPLPECSKKPDNRLHLVFHGNGSADRNLEPLIRAMNLVDDRFQLHLMLTAGAEDGSHFRQLAGTLPRGPHSIRNACSSG